jgi:hypothetical protein
MSQKVIIGALITITIGLGGYIFQSKDKTAEAQGTAISTLQTKVAETDTKVESLEASSRAQYAEILRRLERIERNQDRASGTIRKSSYYQDQQQ